MNFSDTVDSGHAAPLSLTGAIFLKITAKNAASGGTYSIKYH
jgi:hypothetical protein